MNMNTIFNYFGVCYDGISSFYDDYYLGWVVAPIFFTVVLPILFVFLFYMSIMTVLIYTWHWGQFKAAYGVSLKNGALYFLCAMWDVHSRLLHGHEIIGIDKIPLDGPALFIFYHGSVPIDFFYLLAKVYVLHRRIIFSIGDNFLYKIPGFHAIANTINVIPGTVDKCVNILKNGGLLVIFPGGVYESQFGDSNYKLLWRNRLGFAKVALESKVPVIPVFTQNIREAFVSLPLCRPFWLKLYSWTRLPLVPILGEFPVKMRTFIGDPIPYEPLTPEEFKLKIAKAVDEMIVKHQRLPGSITQAILDRFRSDKLKS